MSSANPFGPEGEGLIQTPGKPEDPLPQTPDNLIDSEAERQSRQRSRLWGLRQTLLGGSFKQKLVRTVSIGLVFFGGLFDLDHQQKSSAPEAIAPKIETVVPAAALPPSPNEAPVIAPAAKATAISTAEVVPTKAATATIEAVAYRSEEEISQIQKENIAQNKFPYLDTWSNKGGEAVFSPGASGLNMLGVTKLERGSVYSSPFPGKIRSVERFTLMFPKRAQLMMMKVDLTPSLQMDIFFYPDQKILASEGDVLSNTPLFEVEDTDLLPIFSPKTIPAQIYMDIVDSKTGRSIKSFTSADILKNNQNQIVQAAPASK